MVTSSLNIQIKECYNGNRYYVLHLNIEQESCAKIMELLNQARSLLDEYEKCLRHD